MFSYLFIYLRRKLHVNIIFTKWGMCFFNKSTETKSTKKYKNTVYRVSKNDHHIPSKTA